MEPIFGFALFLVSMIVISVVSAKRGQLWFVYLLVTPALGFGIVILCNMVGASPFATAFAAFLSPLAILFFSLAQPTAAAKAVTTGDAGDYRKCPFCAEAIRKEAIKCRHCGSSVEPA